jgi:hypothetical protein
MEEKNKIVENLVNQVGPMITADDDRFKGITFKGVENDPKDGMHVRVATPDGEGKVPVTMDMIQKGYQMLVQSRDPAKYAEFMQKRLEHKETLAGLDKRAEGNNRTQLQVGRENNASAEKVAGIRAAALQTRGGGAGGVPGLTPELNQQRIAEMQAIEDDHTLTNAQKDDQMNRVQLKYNAKAAQLREPNPAKVGLKDGLSSDGLTLTMDGKVYNRSMDGRSWEPVQMPNESGEEVRYDAQGNAWVKGPDGKPVRKQ